MAFQNVYTHRKVADTVAKRCEICYKPSTSVLITADKKDFFYVCPSHLKERGFCTPVIDHAAVEAKKKKEMEEEIARVKKEYEEKQKKKKDKDKDKDKDKSKDKAKDDNSNDDSGKKEENAATDDDKKDEASSPPAEEEPRIFALQRTFFQQRLDKKRQAEVAKRNRERIADPSFFPSVPKGPP